MSIMNAATLATLLAVLLSTASPVAVDAISTQHVADVDGVVTNSEWTQAASGRALLVRQRAARRPRGTARASPIESPPVKSPLTDSPPPDPPATNKRLSFPSDPLSSTSGGGGGGGSAGGKTFSAHGTHFDGMGKPTGGCGVPPGKAFDDNGVPLPYVALNTNSEFSNGDNCGRWVQISLGSNCQGAGNTAFSVCNGGSWVSDQLTGDKIYGYVMDSCDDDNFWCQDDPYHLDISRPYLTGMDMVGKMWNGRKISWSYMNGTPPGWKMSQPKFMWKSGTKWIRSAKGFYASVIIYNVSNGIGGVQQLISGAWVPLDPLQHLGNMWILEQHEDYRSSPGGGEGKSFTLRVLDVDGTSYGDFKVDWECGGDGPCSSEVDASATPV